MENNELNTAAPQTDGTPDSGINTDKSGTLPDMPNKKPKKKKLSGAYYYIDTDEAQLAKASFNRTLAAVIALLLQVVVLLLPQGGLEYITHEIPSYAYVYMWAVFLMLIASVYVIIMNMTRCKLKKRIPKEHAPKNGFKRRTFFSSELFIAVNALTFVIELTFVCIHYDGIGLASMFICALATAAAVGARQIGWLALRNAELIAPPDDGDAREDA